MLYLDRSEGDWAADQGVEYVFTITAEGLEWVCSYVGGGEASCDEGATLHRFSSGMEPNQVEGLFALGLVVYTGPTSVTIERDGVVVFEDDYDIVESVDRPNGRRCEPECRFWSGSASW